MLLFRLMEVFFEVVFLHPSRKLSVGWSYDHSREDHPVSRKKYSWWTLLHVSCLPWGGFFISLCPRGWPLCWCFARLISLSSTRQTLARPVCPCCILLLSRCWPSMCLTFLAKCTSFLVKCVALLVKCVAWFISLLWITSYFLLFHRESHSRCLALVYYLHIASLSTWDRSGFESVSSSSKDSILKYIRRFVSNICH